MTFWGLLVGAAAFLIIGVCHPLVIKAEYYFGKKCWPVFLAAGLAGCAGSIFVGNLIVSILLAVLGFAFFWGIGELFEQEERVKKGWFPANPKKK